MKWSEEEVTGWVSANGTLRAASAKGQKGCPARRPWRVRILPAGGVGTLGDALDNGCFKVPRNASLQQNWTYHRISASHRKPSLL